MSDDKIVEAETPKTEVKATSTTKKSGGSKPVILIVILLILCCCCATIIGGVAFLYSRAQSLGYTDWSDIVRNSNSILNNMGPGPALPPGAPPTNPGSNGSNGGGYLDDIPSATLPAGFPNDIPLFPNSKIVFGTHDAESGYVVSLAAKATAADVSAYYRGELQSKGWTITSEQTFLGDIITAEKNNRELTVLVYDATDAGLDQLASSITLSVTEN